MPNGQSTKKPGRPKPGGLTPKQALFVREYPIDCNATAAAIRAGYSRKGARTEGTRLLQNAVVQAKISAMVDNKLSKVDMTFDDLLEQATHIGNATVDKLFNPKGWEMVPPSELPNGIKSALQSVDVVHQPDGTVSYKYRFWPKLQALDLIAKLKGLVTKKVEVEDKSWREILRQMDEEDQAKP